MVELSPSEANLFVGENQKFPFVEETNDLSVQERNTGTRLQVYEANEGMPSRFTWEICEKSEWIPMCGVAVTEEILLSEKFTCELAAICWKKCLSHIEIEQQRMLKTGKKDVC